VGFGPLGSTTATATATTATATTGFTEIWVGDWDGGDRYTDPHKFGGRTRSGWKTFYVIAHIFKLRSILHNTSNYGPK